MMQRKTLFQRLRLTAMLIVLLLVPWLVDAYWLNVVIAILLAVPGALALSLLTGVAGQISLGNAAFMGIGATTAGLLGGQLNWPFLVVLVCAGLVSGLVGVLVGIPSLRVRGLYLIIATLALQFVIQYVIQKVQSDTAGVAGFLLPLASVGSLTVDTPRGWYFTLLAFAAIVTMMHINLVRTRAGRAWSAIRERDIAAEIIGIPVARYKISAFVVSSVVIGLQGALMGYYLGLVTYDMFTLSVAITYVAMIIIGGLGSHVGAIYGAAFVTAIPYLLPRLADQLPTSLATHLQSSIFNVQTFLYGLLVVLFLLFEPKGLAEITRRARQYFVLWPFSRERLAEEEQ
jgi:branched-chain amino acid transport system permease protein